MAYLNQDEEETKGQGLNQTLGQPQGQPQAGQEPSAPEAPAQSSAPATIGANTAQPSAPMPQQKQQKAGTGTFTNLRNYLQANQGNRVASAASQRVANVATGAQRGVQQAQQTFGQRVEQGSIKNFGGARQEAQGTIQAGTQATYQAPQPQAQQPTQQATSEAPQAATPAPTPASTFSEEQKQRFAEILNAQYKGPQSLQQAGLYEPAAQRVRTATQAAQQTQSAGGREQLLKDTFGRNRDYTRGQSKLDALLLNTSEQGVKNLQQQGQQAAATQAALDTAQNVSSNTAQQRIADTAALRQNVRQDFTQAQTGLESGVNQRIEAMTTAVAKDEQGNAIVKRDAAGNEVKDAAGNPVYLTEWERLPDYFRQRLIDRSGPNKSLDFSAEEAAMLGIGQGTGLYNLTADAIKTAQADRTRLISKDELTRLQALSQLAGLDADRALKTQILGGDAYDLEKAGTQDAMSALDRTATQQQFKAAEEAFRQQAEQQDIVGAGSKKHRSTGKRYYAEETANLADVLKRAGYDFGSELPELASPEEMMAAARGSVAEDQDLVGPIDAATAPYSDNTTMFNKGATGFMDTATGGGTALMRSLGLDVAGAATRGLESVFGGGRPSSAYAKNIAKRNARRDLQAKTQQAIEQSGFLNRATISDTEEARARTAALQKILASRDKTNR